MVWACDQAPLVKIPIGGCRWTSGKNQGKQALRFPKSKKQKKGERKHTHPLQSSANQDAGMTYNFLQCVGE